MAKTIIAGTLDTKGAELHFMRDILLGEGLDVQVVDLSTSGVESGADVTPATIAAHHPRSWRPGRYA